MHKKATAYPPIYPDKIISIGDVKSVGVEEPLRANYGNYAENATTWGELHDSSLFGLHVA